MPPHRSPCPSGKGTRTGVGPSGAGGCRARRPGSAATDACAHRGPQCSSRGVGSTSWSMARLPLRVYSVAMPPSFPRSHDKASPRRTPIPRMARRCVWLSATNEPPTPSSAARACNVCLCSGRRLGAAGTRRRAASCAPSCASGVSARQLPCRGAQPAARNRDRGRQGPAVGASPRPG